MASWARTLAAAARVGPSAVRDERYGTRELLGSSRIDLELQHQARTLAAAAPVGPSAVRDALGGPAGPPVEDGSRPRDALAGVSLSRGCRPIPVYPAYFRSVPLSVSGVGLAWGLAEVSRVN